MNRRNILSVSTRVVLGLTFLGITGGASARAAEIKLLSAVALHPAIDALIPDFEASSGYKIAVAYGTAGAVADRVQNGEAADVVISSVPMIDRLQARGKVGVCDIRCLPQATRNLDLQRGRNDLSLPAVRGSGLYTCEH